MLESMTVGAMGWQCKEFYPEGLPDAWQLDYYANEFSALLVPQAQWSAWEDADWSTFFESSDTLHWCGFGVKAALDEAQAANLHQALSMLHARGQSVGIASHVALPALLSQWPVTWFDRPEVQSQWCWHHLSGAPMGWLSEWPQDMQGMRQMLEAFVASLPEKDTGIPFVVRNGCDNIQKLKALKQLVELLGY